MSDSPELTRPVLQALILADDIYTDQQTGKKVIAGTFGCLWASEFPTQFSRKTKAYVNLTNCHGKLVLKLQWIDLKDDSVLMASPEIQIQVDDPLVNCEVIIEVPGFPLPHEGMFAFELYCNEHRLGALRIVVAKAEHSS